MGGYTTAFKEVVDMLRQKGRPYLFSNALPPAVVASTMKVFDILQNDSSRVEKVLITPNYIYIYI